MLHQVPGAFGPLGHARGTGARMGGCRGSLLGLQAGFQTQRQWGSPQLYLSLSLINTLPFSFLFHPPYLVCCLTTPPLPLLSPKPGAMQNELQEKAQQNGKTRDVLSFPLLLCLWRQQIPVSEGKLLLRNYSIKLIRASI